MGSGGYVEYLVPRSAGGAELRKLSYVGAFGTGDRMLAIQAGAYVDDIDAVALHRSVWAALVGLLGLAVAGLAAFGLGRGMVVPLAKTCEVMDSLTKGDFAFDVPFVDRKNEIGRIARSLQVFKDHLTETTRLRIEQEREASGQVDAAATLVLNAVEQLTAHSEQLESETGKLLGNIRAA